MGTEDVNGVSATKYTGTVDLSEAVAQLGLPTDAQDKVTQELDKVARTAQVTVWVDSDGRIVRYDQELAVNPDGKHVTEPVTVKSSTTMSDFGVTTDIEPPPADQVTDGSNLSKLMPGGMPTDGSMPGGMSSGA
ncbi:MAG: hypothetical protein U0R64_01720 [Candidatus Nanopelagicales bacterium]